MKVIITPDKCLKENCSVNMALFLSCLYYKVFTPVLLTEAVNKGYITFNDTCFTPDLNKISITDVGIGVIEPILLNSEITETVDGKDRFTELAIKLRELYPQGRKIGTSCQWRDSIAVIALRLKALVKKYGVSFTDEQAINATRKYVESFNGNYQYMQVLKYFIMKNNMADRAEDTSQLLAYIENEDQEDSYQNDNGELV